MSTSPRPVALITGAATGIGRACALRFAKLGYDIAINYSRSESEARDTIGLVRAAGAQAILCRADVASDEQVRGMIEEVEATFQRLDVLVNNAGTTSFIAHTDLDGMTEEAWDRILAVNLKGPFFCVRAARRLLAANGGGAIVSISSVAGISGLGSSIAYCASKGALNTMTKSLARALAPEIRVNAVCPGPVDSRWLKAVMSEKELQDRCSDYPIPRPAQPDDIADAVVYLATGTSLTTGQLLVVDGGRTM